MSRLYVNLLAGRVSKNKKTAGKAVYEDLTELSKMFR